MTFTIGSRRPDDRSVTITSARLFSAPAIYAAPTRAQSVLHPAPRRVFDAFNGTAAMKEEIAERSQSSIRSRRAGSKRRCLSFPALASSRVRHREWSTSRTG
jgi:hypothetical protein